MIQSVKRANDLTDIIKSIGHRWSKAIADQKDERIASLKEAQQRQDEKQPHLMGDRVEILRSMSISDSINQAAEDLKTSYAKLVTNYKAFKKQAK